MFKFETQELVSAKGKTPNEANHAFSKVPRPSLRIYTNSNHATTFTAQVPLSQSILNPLPTEPRATEVKKSGCRCIIM